LTPLESVVGLFRPQRLRPYADGPNPLPAAALHGWEVFAETVPVDVAGPVRSLLDDPSPLVGALERRPTTLVHGDLATVNMAIEGVRLTLLDWSLATRAPAVLDLAWFLAGCASVVDATREDIIADFATVAGPTYDEPALRLALLAGVVWLGWNKALDAAEHPDREVRDQEREDLEWWVAQARLTLDSGLL
jgi:thiamine kinase-like enzyme